MPDQPKKQRRPMRPNTAWGGFVDGKLHWWPVAFGDQTLIVLAVHPVKREVAKAYTDVRRVKITEDTDA